jgi:hypothetical protein
LILDEALNAAHGARRLQHPKYIFQMHAHESRCSMPKKIIIIKIFTGAAVEGKGIPWLQYSEALGY